MELFGVGAFEALLVLVITLVIVGPQRFPEIARQGGRWYRIARRYTAEIMGDVREAVSELESEVKEQQQDLFAIREIGQEVEAGLKDTERDLQALSRDPDEPATDGAAGATGRAAAGSTSPPPVAADDGDDAGDHSGDHGDHDDGSGADADADADDDDGAGENAAPRGAAGA